MYHEKRFERKGDRVDLTGFVDAAPQRAIEGKLKAGPTSKRFRDHLMTVSQVPHPFGSAANRAVGAYVGEVMDRAGLDVVDIVLQPLASSEAVLTEEEKELGIAMVDLGGGTSDLAIFSEGSISHSAVLPVGGSMSPLIYKLGYELHIVMRRKSKSNMAYAWPTWCWKRIPCRYRVLEGVRPVKC